MSDLSSDEVSVHYLHPTQIQYYHLLQPWPVVHQQRDDKLSSTHHETHSTAATATQANIIGIQ